MKRGMKVFLIGSAFLICAAASFLTGITLAVFRGLGTDVSFVPGTCWSSNILVVNRSGKHVDALVIREGQVVFWAGRVADFKGGCVPKRSFSHETASVEATFFDGTRMTQLIERGFGDESIHNVHLLLIEPTEIRHVNYQGTQNMPLGALVDSMPPNSMLARDYR